MPSRIEEEFMIDQGFLALSGFELLPREIRIYLQTWEPENKYLSLLFAEILLTSINPVYDADDSLELPWDIIGFESVETEGKRWRFVLVSNVIELTFESAWPVVMES